MLSIFTVAGGLGGFWLDPICVNLLALSAASSPWYASEIRQWYYSKRIDSPGGEDRIYREGTHTKTGTHSQTGPHTPWEKKKKKGIWQWEESRRDTNRNTRMNANALKEQVQMWPHQEKKAWLKKRHDLFYTPSSAVQDSENVCRTHCQRKILVFVPR